MLRGIYLDNSMTTRPSDQAVSKMLSFFSYQWGTPSAPHQLGQELYPSMAESYKSIYALLGAKDADDFVLTSSGAEAVNHVISSTYFDVTIPTGKNHYITSHIDEAPAIMAIGRLEHLGCVGKMVNADKMGRITPKAVSEAITPRTALISLSWANGLTGVINPVEEIAKICKERGILLHLDATHVLGKHFFDLEETGAHFMTFNGDHLHAPKGTGGLYIQAGTKLSPFIMGGIEQGGYRAGGLNVPGLAALGQASVESLECRDLLCTEVARLRNKLERGIVGVYPEAVPFFTSVERLPHCTTIAFPGISNEAMLYALNRKGVYASIGGGSFQQLGLILMDSGVGETLAHTAISFALSRETTEDEIDNAVEVIGNAAKRLSRLSQRYEFKKK